MVFAEGGRRQTVRNIPTPKADRARFCLSDEEVLELADNAVAIEAHYGRPMDMEWAKDGLDGKLYIVQARPETVALPTTGVTVRDLRARRRRRKS